MKKFRTDYERLEIVKEYIASRKTITAFAKEKGIPYCTMRDWIYAFKNIDGSFVRLNKVWESNDQSVILANDDANIRLIDTETIYKKSSHFSRFDHSIVVLEFNKIKVTTSLEQALAILEKYYDRCK